MHPVIDHKSNKLFLILGSFFVANALIAEFIGVKIFSLEKIFSLAPVNITLFGQVGLSFNLTAGVLLWPVVFVMTDLINEYYGQKGVRLLSYIAIGLILYAFVMLFCAIQLPPADFWIIKKTEDGQMLNMEVAFRHVYGQGLWIIGGSITAFLLGQLLDVTIFHWIKRKTGESKIWLRATGSTLISQLIDSFVVLLIAFYLGAGWKLELVLAIGVVNYIYKFAMAIILTPVIYLIHDRIEKYLGHELSSQLRQQAMQKH